MTDRSADPLRPSDHVDGSGDSGVESPKLNVVGWLRWGWRQLTSMRTALVLLLILAIAAIPGSIFPQRMADPNGVTQYKTDHPDLFPIMDSMQLFDVYLSAWFSAIYLLLFLSLVGCVIPRIKHHAKALRSLPPRTPARLQRLDDHRAVTRAVADGDPRAAAERTVGIAQKQLRALRYRVERYDDARGFSVSAERGYARETGNLIFHLALVGVLVSVGLGGSYAYTGQRVVVEGTTFVNTLLDYSSMNRGRFVSDDALQPYRMTLDSFDVTYQPTIRTSRHRVRPGTSTRTSPCPNRAPPRTRLRCWSTTRSASPATGSTCSETATRPRSRCATRREMWSSTTRCRSCRRATAP